MRRRDLLRATGLAAAGTAGVAGLGTGAATEYDNYEFLGAAPAPGAEEAVVEGRYAYVATGGGVTTVDLAEPTLPVTLGRTEGDHPGDSADVKAEFDTDVVGLTANSGQGGVSFFDISDPANPTFEAFYPAASHIHNHHIRGNHAYLTVTDDFGHSRMVIVRIRNDSGEIDPVTLEGPDDVQYGVNMPADQRGTNGAWMLRDAQPAMAKAGINPLHDLVVRQVGDSELAYLAYWEAGVVVVDVTDKENPVAVGHFGATDDAGNAPSNVVTLYGRYITGPKSNAHYVEPTPDGDYTFVGAETFGGGAGDIGAAKVTGGFGGIRVFDTRGVTPLADGGAAVYPEADGYTGSNTAAPEPTRDHLAYVAAPDQPDRALLTSHNFDVTDTKLFTSWYQGGLRAYDLGPLYADDGYGAHASDPSAPTELAAFAPDGTAFWTAENLAAEQGETYYTVGSDIGKGIVVLELNSGSHKLP